MQCFEFLRSWQRKNKKQQDPKLHEADKQTNKRKRKGQKGQNIIIIQKSWQGMCLNKGRKVITEGSLFF